MTSWTERIKKNILHEDTEEEKQRKIRRRQSGEDRNSNWTYTPSG
jgi:hypothetical protein